LAASRDLAPIKRPSLAEPCERQARSDCSGDSEDVSRKPLAQ